MTNSAAHVDYGAGCTLITVGEVTFNADTRQILPGDTTTVIEATVTNRYSTPIRITGTAVVDDTPTFAEQLVVKVGLSGKRWIWDWPDRKEGQ